MVYRHEESVVPLYPVASDCRDFARIISEQFPGGRSAKGDDDLGVNEVYLFKQVGYAGLYFPVGRNTVIRWTTTHNIADKYMLLPGKAAGG